MMNRRLLQKIICIGTKASCHSVSTTHCEVTAVSRLDRAVAVSLTIEKFIDNIQNGKPVL